MKPTGNPHAMPMPTNVPWRSESMPWSMTAAMQNGVMQFSAPNLMPEPFFRRTMNLHKRKSEIVPPLPNKQHITEEKITAHFSGMHISSNYTQHSSPQDDDDTECDTTEPSMEYDFNSLMTQRDLEMKLKNANRITLCDEIKKMHAAHSNFMPNALINRIERPCTALVLWQPPAKLEDLVTGKCRPPANSSIEFDDDDEQNNNSIDGQMSSMNIPSTDGMDTDL